MAILGTVLPPFVILSVISIFYNAFRNNWLISQLLEGMQAGVGAVIASVTVDMGMPIIKEKDSLSLVIMVGAFIAACVFSINVVYIVITCGIIGVIRILLSKGEVENDIFTIILELYSDRDVQLWWWICRHAPDSGTGSY